MSYRDIDFNRCALHVEDMRQAIGQTAVWKQWVSASTGTSIFGGTAYYREQTVTAFFGQYVQPSIREHQTPAGEIIAGMFNVVGPFAPGLKDELIWRGDMYRVESEAVPARIAGQYTTLVKRASGQ